MSLGGGAKGKGLTKIVAKNAAGFGASLGAIARFGLHNAHGLHTTRRLLGQTAAATIASQSGTAATATTTATTATRCSIDANANTEHGLLFLAQIGQNWCGGGAQRVRQIAHVVCHLGSVAGQSWYFGHVRSCDAECQCRAIAHASACRACGCLLLFKLSFVLN